MLETDTQTNDLMVETAIKVSGKKIIQHSCKTQEHNTPPYILDPVVKVLGDIDLDPASNAIANERVGAKQFYTKYDDGLTQPWFGKVFCNPPGGKVGNKSLNKLFWQKLVDEYLQNNVKEAIFLAYSIELLQTSQNGEDVSAKWATSYPLCIPSSRINYLSEYGIPQTQPPNASCIIYLPPRYGEYEKYDNFNYHFASIGAVIVPSPRWR